jgi:polyvinyl alcohol dehydrogenase (cytochrome)
MKPPVATTPSVPCSHRFGCVDAGYGAAPQARREFVMERSILNWVCVLALVALPVGGCSEETAATGGTGGDGGGGGSGGDGGSRGMSYGDWPSAGHDLFHTGHNPDENAISVGNVTELALNDALSRVTPDAIDGIDLHPTGPGIEPSRQVIGTVVVADGVAYFVEDATVHSFAEGEIVHGAGVANVIAMVVQDGAVLGAASGDILWTQAVSMANESLAGFFAFSASQAAPVLSDTAVFVPTVDSMHKLDRVDGRILWSSVIDDMPYPYVVSDPILFDGKVMVGVSSSENFFLTSSSDKGVMRQKVIAFDEMTGDVAWEAFTVSDPTLEYPKYGSGAGIWSSPAIDPDAGLLYVGTGQRHTCGSDRIEETDSNDETVVLCEGGPVSPESADDEDYTDSLIVVDVDTGDIVNHRQFTENDIWAPRVFSQRPGTIRDADVGIPPTLFSIPDANGGTRALVGVGDKAGDYYVMDRSSLDIVWQRHVSQPSVIGGFQSTAAYADGVLYVTAHEDFFGEPLFTNPLVGGNQSVRYAYGSRSNLKALDAATGEVHWEKTIQGPTSFSPLIISNGVLYFGGADGIVRAYEASSGDLLVELPGLQTRPEAHPIEGEDTVPRTSAVASMSISHGHLFVSHLGFGVPLGGMLVYSLP